jgi:hypothetical protein
MRKWIGPCVSLLIVVVLLVLSGPSVQTEGDEHGQSLVFAQDKRDLRKEDDSHFIQILVDFEEIVDGWLKSLNERIESEDVTRLEVRFLEVLRNILEWVRDKLDEQIASTREKQKRDKGIFRETRVGPFVHPIPA